MVPSHNHQTNIKTLLKISFHWQRIMFKNKTAKHNTWVKKHSVPTQMNSPNDLLSAHSLGDPGPTTVYQPHDVTALGAGLAHDGHLGP